MKIHVVFVVLAISGASGLATANVAKLDAPDLGPVFPPLAAPQTPVLLFQPTALASLPTTPLLSGEQAVASASTTVARAPERVDQLPTHLLLSDGSLVATYGSAEEGAFVRGLLLASTLAMPTPSMPDAPPADAANADDDPSTGLEDEATIRTRIFSPDTTMTQRSRVFDPRPAEREGPSGVFVAGGLALAALASMGVLLYHRLRPHAALENDTRKVIFDAVCGSPGLGVHEISRIASVSYSTTTYHLERLVGAGMLVMTPDGNKLCYYKNGGAFSESERKILPLVKNEEAAKLFEAILDAPGTYRAALAEKLGVTATTINWHLRRLREAGLVDETRAGRSAFLYARVDTMRPTFSSLAAKVETSEPIIAERLRKYAGDASAVSGAIGAA
jgi:DNA-binding transcriptional ArsR family regulator